MTSDRRGQVSGKRGLTLRITAKWINSRTLGCPDTKCPGHDIPLQIT